MSIQVKYQILEDCYPDILSGIGSLIQKSKLSNRFDSISLESSEIDKLINAKELCELEIINLWENQDSLDFRALSSTYFDIASQINVNTDSEYFIFEHLKMIAFGYLGEHWHFVRQFLDNHPFNFTNDEDFSWNKKILVHVHSVIVSLVKKQSWNNISEAVSSINKLREEQESFEEEFLNNLGTESRPYGAAELVSLYHFAKMVEILGKYLIEGRPLEPETRIDYHSELAIEFSKTSNNISLGMLIKFFRAFAIKMIRNTIWYTTRGVNNWVTRFNNYISQEQSNGILELLYPQRESITRGELLNPAHRAIVINLPTSSGKTLIAEYRILQALNQFRQYGGWVAYVVPTRSLVNQTFIKLSKDLGGIGLDVEKASGAIELDGFEQSLLESHSEDPEQNFDVLVTTYEKLNLMIRQGLGTSESRSLVLTVVDEAHNIEDKTRGLNLEFLLSTIKNDCQDANFLLMTPDISNTDEVIDWLAGERGKAINLSLDWWQPNERVVGAVEVEGYGRKFDFSLRTLHTDKGTYSVGSTIPIARFEDADETKSVVSGTKTKISAYTASKVLDLNSPKIVLAHSVNSTYSIADKLYAESTEEFQSDDDVNLLIKLVKSELGQDFPLAKYLERRIAVHSSVLPDDIKFLIEDLMEKEKLQALVATTTIAQGINFPVSALIMGSYSYPRFGNMPVRDFWNLAGRVGRAGQKELGWVGLCARNDDDLLSITEYVRQASDHLHSQLSDVIEKAMERPNQDFSRWLYFDERWSAVLQYISHLRKQTEQQDVFLAQLEQKLKDTFGYKQLTSDKQVFLKNNIRRYASELSFDDARRADETGFSTVSVRQMISKLRDSNFTAEDWSRDQLFSEQNQSMQKLVGIMLDTYEIRKSINDLNESNTEFDRTSISRLIIDWVNGNDILTISQRFYPDDEGQDAIKKTTNALYKIVANAATWGFAALQKMPTNGLDWENLSEIEKRKLSNLPAYLHYGVNTDEGVLMRKNNVPRSIANTLGNFYSESVDGQIFDQTTSNVTQWISGQEDDVWDEAKPEGSILSGNDYKKVWEKLSGLE